LLKENAMSIKFESLEIKAKVPELPQAIPVFALAAPTLEERRTPIARLGEHLKLGALRQVEVDHGTVMASEQGDITYFHASGAVWARDAKASNGASNEFRKWEGLVELNSSDGQRMALNSDASRKLLAQAKELLKPLGLLGQEIASEAIQLDQVEHLDAKGKVLERGAGPATIKFQYAVQSVPVRGAGAKTLVFAEPGGKQARIGGIFHAWRTLGKGTVLKLPSIEAALGVGLLTDPELDRYNSAGHKIQISRLELVYLALPAFTRQGYLFPALQIEGTVSEGKLGISFHFARFHHAAPPRAYAAAKLYGPYLTINPDGISPSNARKSIS
jgi:hypothetical protein